MTWRPNQKPLPSSRNASKRSNSQLTGAAHVDITTWAPPWIPRASPHRRWTSTSSSCDGGSSRSWTPRALPPPGACCWAPVPSVGRVNATTAQGVGCRVWGSGVSVRKHAIRTLGLGGVGSEESAVEFARRNLILATRCVDRLVRTGTLLLSTSTTWCVCQFLLP
jgi:hypothetical protein